VLENWTYIPQAALKAGNLKLYRRRDDQWQPQHMAGRLGGDDKTRS
jgi:hypothetical protein